MQVRLGILGLVCVLALCASTAMANGWHAVTPDGTIAPKEASSMPDVTVDRADSNGVSVSVSFPGIELLPTKIDEGEFLNVSIPGAGVSGAIGTPNLPALRRMIVVPDGATVSVRTQFSDAIVVDSSLVSFGQGVMPVQAPVEKIPGALENAPFDYDEAAYKVNAFGPAELVNIHEVGIVRGQRLVQVEFLPVSYNPVANTINFYQDITAVVSFSGGTSSSDLNAASWVNNQVLNPTASSQRAGGNYLIIVTDTLAPHIVSFANAKTSQGFNVFTEQFADGTANSTIKSTIATYYAGANAPDYVLLVGDTNFIPNWVGGGEGSPNTDLQYVCMDGASDWFPDIAYGRLPARNSTELAAIVEKILDYENRNWADADYIYRAAFIAGVDNNDITEGTHNYAIDTYLEPNDYTCERVYEVTYGADTQDIADAFNAGVFYGFFSGHGASTYWADGPEFHQSDVNALTNYQMYAFVASFACVTGSYTMDECFTETWSKTPGKGACAIYGSSVNSYWDEDDILERALFDCIFDENDPKNEVSPAWMEANVRLYNHYNPNNLDSVRRYFEMYNLMGDPSMPLPSACSDAGSIDLDRGKYACDDTITITVSDCGLDVDSGVVDTVTVSVASGTEPAGELVVLTETDVDSARFEGTLPIATVNAPGLLYVANGDTITATYTDADDGQGGFNVDVTADAVVDCDAPSVWNVQTTNIEPRSADVTFDADEPVQGTVYYGPSCDQLTEVAGGGGYATSAVVSITGLQDNNTYFYSVKATDEAGNNVTVDNGGACYSFSTPEIPDFFTEQFESGLDVDGMQLFFIPNGSYDYYMGCNYDNLVSLPTDPSGGTTLSLTDDDTEEVMLTGGAQVYLYGQAYSSVWICSNGHLTFGVEDDEHDEDLEAHFLNPRVAALFDDFNPVDGGSVSYKQLADRFVVTWQNVPQYNTTGDSNTFQAELFFDGMITTSYLGLGTSDGIIGLSDGSGLDPDFYPSDLSNMGPCGDRPPSASGGSVHADLNTATTIDLVAGDDGQPDPPAALTYIVTALPAHGTLSDPGAGAIASAPYTLVGGGNAVVYSPSYNYQGPDSLQYKANDGGVAPDGGDSNIATVSIVVGGPAAVYSFPLDVEPMWMTEGQWAFGQPTGEGSHNLDPVEGYTGRNVYGYNLEGDYPHSMSEMALTTAAMDCTDVTSVELHFWRWLGVESASYDHARIDVSNDGVNWELVWDHTDTTAISDSSWNEMIYDVSAVADNQPTVFFRWIMGGTDTSVSYPGWNIDDIEIWGIVPLTECPFDLDGSGFVGTGDINLIKANYGAVTPETEAYDLDGSGFVGTGDINLIKANYGPCP